MKPVAIYLRVSSDEQREKHTIETQRVETTRYCNNHDLPIYRVYADDGVTSMIPLYRRPAGSELLRDALDKRFSTVIVYRLDRLARRTLEILNVIEFLLKHGVAVRSVTEMVESETPAGRLMVTMLGGFAQHEQDVIRERTLAGERRAAKEGKMLGGVAPYGYKLADKKWLVSEDEAEVVRFIFAEYIAGKSCFHIAAGLTRRGIPPRIAKRWSEVTVLSMIRNESYAGRRGWGKRRTYYEDGREKYVLRPKEELIYIPVPAIISQDQWEAAQRQRLINGKYSRRNSKRVYALKALIKCGVCKYSYCGRTKVYRGVEYRYYHCGSCSAQSIRKGCGNLQVRADELEAAIWAELSGFLHNPRSVIQQITERIKAARGAQGGVEEELARVERDLEKLKAARNRVVRCVASGTFSNEEAADEMEGIRATVERLQAERATLLDRAESSKGNEDKLRDAESVLREVGKLVDNADAETKSRIMRRLVEGITINSATTADGKREIRADVTYHFSPPGLVDCDYHGRPL
ncbi:MAG: recombinase family protein [Acidobacteria bacterium]|nr:recombinase family protein [Acidobacteriota bacterium]